MRAPYLAAGTLCLLLAAQAVAQPPAQYRNATAGGPLRHGVYGRIEIGAGPPPPLIFKQPRVAAQPVGASEHAPVYLYVPPGQVRKWDQHCQKWDACELPVLFVRMDDSPSRLGQWKQRPEPPPAPSFATSVLGAGPSPVPPEAPASRSSRP